MAWLPTSTAPMPATPHAAVPLSAPAATLSLPVPVELSWPPGSSISCTPPSCTSVACGDGTLYTLDATARPYSLHEVAATPPVRRLPLLASFRAGTGYAATAAWPNAVTSLEFGSLVRALLPAVRAKHDCPPELFSAAPPPPPPSLTTPTP